jgi:sulfoxide reductase heme-binding subunit YedZ
MAVGYKAVGWNAFKVRYVRWTWAIIAVFLVSFSLASILSQPAGDSFHPVQLILRAFGVTAFCLLSIILMIGPLARFSPRFKPLLYNRRHLGVSAFVLMSVHAVLALVWYHGFAETNPFVSLIATNTNYDRIGGFPFESLGLIAFVILFLMAATSHDFWLANLGAPFWKALHMGVYLAYALLVMHVMLGVVQSEKAAAYPIWVLTSASLVAVLHIAAGVHEWRRDRRAGFPEEEGWIRVGPVGDLIDGRGVILPGIDHERIALFRYDGKLSAISNACKHQNGPLGEGRMSNGCVVCPWHGFEYNPADGRAPEPFTERIATYQTQIRDGIVYVNERAHPPGTYLEPSLIEEDK